MSLKTFDRMGRQKVAVPVSADDRLVGGELMPLLWETFADTTASYAHKMRWRDNGNTGAINHVANAAFIQLNSSSTTLVSRYWRLESLRRFRWIPGTTLAMRTRLAYPTGAQANVTMEVGLSLSSSSASAPTDGAFFRWASDGTFRCVTTLNAGETVSAAKAAPAVNTMHSYTILLRPDAARFLIDDGATLDYATPLAAGTAQPTSVPALQAAYAIRIVGGAAAAAPILKVADVLVGVVDAPGGARPWREVLGGAGSSAHTAPTTTYAQTANWANSVAPVAAALSNTVPSYATLGGLFSFVVPAAAATDYALFGYQVPALGGRSLYVTEAVIATSVAANLGAAATIMSWALGANSSAASLATADDTLTARARRVVPLGVQSFPLSAAAGVPATTIAVSFSTPVVVNPGMYLHVILRLQLSAGSGTLAGLVGINGYFD